MNMIRNFVFLSLFLLPVLSQAQNREDCADLIVVPKALYDKFQSSKANLAEADRQIFRQTSILEDLQKKYLRCETQSDVAAMLRQSEENIKSLEADKKVYAEAFEQADSEVRTIIRNARDRPVGYRYYEDTGGLGRVAIVNFSIVDGKVATIVSYYQLPDTAVK